MTKIRMVGTTCTGEGVSGVLLDVHFMNGQAVVLPLGKRARDPSFATMLLDERLFTPQTDGNCIYWRDGPSLSCAEILQMIWEDTV